MEDATSTRKRDTKNSQKFSKRPLVVTNKHPENQDYSAPQNFQLE